ncbi:unnamed protein product [Paramecium primaurelia]|uniref:DNA/RNA-binding protein Alba-like domain-containing protein n=1 Tax=Paramecium primaurelia TaxID=5886 RepID=A0A8S1PAM1_PARPR|nr:unnamed protein product [Paramecium primaurelia]
MDRQQQQQQQQFQQTPKQKLDPQDNNLQVSMRKSLKAQVFIAKIFLKKFGNVELHALGEASKNTVKVADTLSKQGIATITKINSQTLENNERKKVKLIVSLTLTPEGRKRVDQELN